MSTRRDFLQMLGVAASSGILFRPAFGLSRFPGNPYDLPEFGNATILHLTDCHAQLLPTYYREPDTNIGVGSAKGKIPHVVGHNYLDRFSLVKGTPEAYAFTHLDFPELAKRYGKTGGFAHLASLVNRIRAQRGAKNCLFLDGGDSWQGSATALWTKGKDMVGAANLLGVDAMTGHWEFTYGEDTLVKNVECFNGEFIAQNIRATEEALFSGIHLHDEEYGYVFKPYILREIGNRRIAVIGQAFPYTPIANPKRFIPNWRFGIQEVELQQLVTRIRTMHKPDAVLLLSHNGMDVDLKLGSRVTGIDLILGGHTHDAVPQPVLVSNRGGKTIVTNGGSNGKFLAVCDLDIGKGRIRDFRYRLLPVFSQLLEEDSTMSAYIKNIRAPYRARLETKLAVTEGVLYRRGNFDGTFDRLICDALRTVLGAEISFSPGFRWGTTLLPGEIVTQEAVMSQTAITYPETYVRHLSGLEIKNILEDVADNIFNSNPYYQQGGDMIRLSGLSYRIEPWHSIGNRISNLRLSKGVVIEKRKKYTVAGWGAVNSVATGSPVWEVLSEYLVKTGRIQPIQLHSPEMST